MAIVMLAAGHITPSSQIAPSLGDACLHLTLDFLAAVSLLEFPPQMAPQLVQPF